MVWIIVVSLIVLLAVCYMIYSMPAERRPKRKKKAPPAPPVADKDWEEIAKRWEKHNNALLADIEKQKFQERKNLQEMEGLKAIQKDLLDKLALEKGWREKEQVNLDKARAHEKELKDQIFRTEKDLEREHSARLRLERELQELKAKADVLSDEKRTSTTTAKSLEATVAQLSAELKQLRKQQDELKKQRADIQWVAKSEYDELLKKYQAVKPSS
jgi:hypothetical protein